MKKVLTALLFLLLPSLLFAGGSGQIPTLLNIRVEFILFGLTLLGVAFFHKQTLMVALIGLAVILAFKFIFDPGFNLLEHLFGHNSFQDQILHSHLRQGEWTILLNLLGLLVGFAILSKHFEESEVPDWLPKLLPDNWKGPLLLLCMVFVLSSFLDNIAAAMIGGTIALVVFKGKVHIGYLAGIVAASNAGGSGSVIGDTTTTMMWISGVPALNVLHAYIAAFAALACFAIIASFQQHKYQKIQRDPSRGYNIRWNKLFLVVGILAGTILTNILFDFPALGVWIAILVGAIFVKTPWHEARTALPGSIFLLSLVTCASMMPVDQLPPASWQSAFVLGFVSSVFDNIPLTKLALEQGGFDWGMLAYAVGFGGSMVWFGSSAGVAISNKFHEAKSVARWLANGWHVAVAYVVGFLILLGVYGWHPEEIVKKEGATPTEQVIH
ncbi:MAG TPA: SLC13 family permease [Bacteroidales bacterium]|nr:SLC13 family permease [Bacteroidales bacterium]HRZ21026.1 SLC13 family permease [Bacteroidales bacterium]